MPRIFISYRRDDTLPYAGRLCDALANEFGRDHVFMDIDSIRPGREFTAVLQEAIGRCDVLLVLIGRQWLTITGPTGRRRLDDPADFVRQEIVAGLERKITIIPVLFQNVSVPRASDLPEALASLVSYQASEIDDEGFKDDVRRLIRAIRLGHPDLRHGVLLKSAASIAGIALAACLGWILFKSSGSNPLPKEWGGAVASNSVAAANTSPPSPEATNSAKIIFKQTNVERLKRHSYIKEIRLLQETNNTLLLEVDYKYNGSGGVNDIVMRAEAFNVRGDKFAGSNLPAPAGVGEATVELLLTMRPVWLPLTTTNLDVAFYHHDKPNRTYEYLEGETVPFIKSWK